MVGETEGVHPLGQTGVDGEAEGEEMRGRKAVIPGLASVAHASGLL